MAIPAKVTIVGPWKQIVSINDTLVRRGIDLKKVIRAEISNGSNTYFWLDNWLGEIPLHIRFPNIFSLENNKLCKVNEHFSPNSSGPQVTWDWARPILVGIESTELQNLLDVLLAAIVSQGLDKQFWKLDSSSLFTVSSIKKFLSSVDRTQPSRVFSWNNWTRKKVGMVAWRAEKDKLPTRDALLRRRISITDAACVLCGDYVESSEHLFVACQFAQKCGRILPPGAKFHPLLLSSSKICWIFTVTVRGRGKEKTRCKQSSI
ncbi:uncharacterized protein LOC110920232 [Helianthus annuus]|uniref:uncharacterized protein LOC110920232 n=1 Tax=Helianthus annuus TaxID=4232 RepID=UPI000B8FAAA3|nr:uncharacterized protein LOC110920232 [Helianthus annuus]